MSSVLIQELRMMRFGDIFQLDPVSDYYFMRKVIVSISGINNMVVVGGGGIKAGCLA